MTILTAILVCDRDEIKRAAKFVCSCKCMSSFEEVDIWRVRNERAELPPKALQTRRMTEHVAAYDRATHKLVFRVDGKALCRGAYCALTGIHYNQGNSSLTEARWALF